MERCKTDNTFIYKWNHNLRFAISFHPLPTLDKFPKIHIERPALSHPQTHPLVTILCKSDFLKFYLKKK